jgi:hypothetical protein
MMPDIFQLAKLELFPIQNEPERVFESNELLRLSHLIEPPNEIPLEDSSE